jgi:glycosyltransferase involved in cell wall biosynthesis
MKVFVLTAGENWICERFSTEWSNNNQQIYTSDINEADTLWLLSPWVWKRVPAQILRSKKVVATIHHIVKEKFSRSSLREFLERDKFVDTYHVTTTETWNLVSQMTEKPVCIAPFWANQQLWTDKPDKSTLRQEYEIPENKFVIGSFQRDTEGHDLKSPKLEKGPDIFCDIVQDLHNQRDDVFVVLAGWRRQYVVDRLSKAGVAYKYFELPPFDVLNNLYNCLDLYIVSSRTEGGPQAIVECALTKTPIVSTKVGVAPLILANESLYEDAASFVKARPNVEHASQSVQQFTIPHWFDQFNKIFNMS